MSSRRDVLTGALPALALTAVATPALAAPAEQGCGGISRADYDRYIGLYNAADPGFASFYQPDVVMETVPPLTSAAAILAFRRDMSVYISEHITVEYFVSDATGAAAQFLGEFTCVRDMPATAFSGLFRKAVAKGQVLRQRGMILYGVKDGKFTFIRANPPIILHDWA